MLKKILTSALMLGLFFSPLLADNDIEMHGQITNVDAVQKTIALSSVNGEVVIQVFPYTEIKGDDCGAFKRDTRETFEALKTGMFVEVEALPQANGSLSAKSIEWKCGKMAY